MKLKTSITSIALGAVLVALGVCAFVESPSAAPAPTPSPALLINGAGATFPYPIYSKWFDEYHKLHPDIRIQLSIDRFGRRHPADYLPGRWISALRDGPMTDDRRLQPDQDATSCTSRRFWARMFRRTTSRASTRNSTSLPRRWPGFSWGRSPNGMIRPSPAPTRA